MHRGLALVRLGIEITGDLRLREPRGVDGAIRGILDAHRDCRRTCEGPGSEQLSLERAVDIGVAAFASLRELGASEARNRS